MYGKLENNKLIIAPSHVVIGDAQIFNPTDAQYEQLGYKLLVYSTPLEYKVGYRIVENWSEEEDRIVQSWNYEESPEEMNAEEALNIILGV